MNYIFVLSYFLSTIIFFYCSVQSHNCSNFNSALYTIINKKKERAENAQIVLSNIAQMIGQIGNIIEEPHNADNVENAVTNIVNNIVKITINAIQNKSITNKDASVIMQVLQELCKDFDEDILRATQLSQLQ